MKKYAYIYKGRICEICEAQEWADAVRIFDKMGYLICKGDVVEL